MGFALVSGVWLSAHPVLAAGASAGVIWRGTDKSVLVAPALSYTVDITPPTITRFSSAPARAHELHRIIITVLTNASSGYQLTVATNPVLAPDEGTTFTVTGTGAGDPGFRVSSTFAGGTTYAADSGAGAIVARSTNQTGSTPNVIVITECSVVDLGTSEGDGADALTLTLSPNYG